MKVTVLRGISGSGKTTWANLQRKDALVVSADDFFMVDGVYQYDPSKLAEHHNRCLRLFLEAIFRSEPWIIVDNTNIQTWEYAPYVLAAEAFGAQTELLTFTCSAASSYARKQLVPLQDLERTHSQLTQATQRMPNRFKELYRELCTD